MAQYHRDFTFYSTILKYGHFEEENQYLPVPKSSLTAKQAIIQWATSKYGHIFNLVTCNLKDFFLNLCKSNLIFKIISLRFIQTLWSLF